MTYQAFKKSKIFLVVLFVAAMANVSFAQATVSSKCGGPVTPTTLENPSPLAIVCPVIRVLNVMVLSVGAVFVFMVLYGAIKLSLSLGDPKGYEGAHQTWVWAVIGLGVIVGFYAILLIMDNIFGLGILTGANPTGIFDNLVGALEGLLSEIGITGL